MQTLNVDTLFTNAIIITMDADHRIINNGMLAVKDASIVWIGTTDAQDIQFTCMQTLDLTGKVIIPGLINTHGHWAMTLFRGLVDDLRLEAWLEKIWQVEAAAINPQTVVTGSEFAVIEMLKAGTTCAADMYWQYFESFDAVKASGFRMVNGPSFADIPGFEHRRDVNYKAAVEFLDHYANDPLIHLCIQAHSTYMTNIQMLEDILRISNDKQIGFITHAAESEGELAQVQQKHGKRPIQVLDDMDLLGEKTLLAHCVHLTDEEIERLAETGTSVSHCVSSNLKLSSGIARIADMVKAGVNVSLGTDGPASNNDLDLLHEAQIAALVQKGITKDPTVLPAEQMFEMLTINGARAVGLSDKIGSLEVGKLADLAVLDFDAVNLTPYYDLYSHLIYAASSADFCHTMVHGKMMMQDRQILTLDEEKIKAEVRSIADKVRQI
ncbi:MAG: amidohydrolase [Anaerolineaceae bacterium]|nr:amidohydrolase [Anaerolineaceae bacterium]